MPMPPAAHQNAPPATRMAAVFFFLPVFCSGFHVRGEGMSLCLQYKTVPEGERVLLFFRGAWHGMAWDGMGLGWAGMVKWCEAKIHEIDGVL